MAHIFAHLLSLLFLAAAIYGPGRIYEGLRPIPDADLRRLARWIYGLTWWSLGLFLLAAAGLLSAVGLAGWAALTVLGLGALTVQQRRSPRPDPDRPDPETASGDELTLSGGSWLYLVLGLVAFPLLLIALGPTRSWDAEVYHLSLPQIYVDHGGFRPVEMSVYSHWPLGVELFFAGAMIVKDYVLAKAVHWGFGLLVCLALVQGFGRRFRGVCLGLGAALLFLANDVVLYEMRVAYVDLALTFYLLAQGHFLSRAADTTDAVGRRRQLCLAGLAAGAAAGVKVSGVLYAVIVGLLYLPRLWRDLRRSGLGAALKPTPWFLVPAAVLSLPWPLKTAWMTGNPFYPFFWSSLGGPDWSLDLGRRFATWQQSIGMGREPLDYALLPLRAALLGEHGYATFDGRIGPFWLVVLPLAAVAAWRGRQSRRPLAVAVFMSLFWALSSQQMRFLLPALAFYARALFVGLDELTARNGISQGAGARRFWPSILPLTGLLLIAFTTEYPKLGRTAMRYAQIFNSPQFSLQDVEPAVAPIIDGLPEDAKILMLRTNQRFDLRRDLLVDSFYLEASQIADWLRPCPDPEAVAEKLRQRGVTHILIGLRHPERPFPYPPALMQLVSDPGRVEVAYRDEAHLLLALGPPPDEDAVPR